MGEVGIKYKKITVNKNKYILIPIDIIEGYSIGDIYYSVTEHKIPIDIKNLKNEKILIDSIISIDDLKYTYEYDEDIEFLKKYYFEEERDYIIVMEIIDNKITRNKINIKELSKTNTKEIYESGTEKTVTLNEDSLDTLLNIEDIELLKKELLRIKKSVSSMNKKEDNVKKVMIENGQIKEITVNKRIKQEEVVEIEENIETKEGISLKGLETYVKERVFGHDEEIKYICKTIMMNHTAIDSEKISPFLIVGMTGTGKTETIKAAASYLGCPYKEINSANLVPQGIKGESLEDCMYSLIIQAKEDIKKAERGMLFFDEFEKLGRTKSEFKEDVKTILLKFIEGAKFTIDTQTNSYVFNTSKLNLAFAGVFEELYKKKNPLGFGGSVQEEPVDLASNIANKDYFGKELLTRIKYFYLFDELSLETKKEILLYSKLSEYLEKKNRYLRQFKVDLIAKDSYINRIMEKLDENNQSIRELNKLVARTLEEVEYELLYNDHRNQKLILTKEIVDNHHNFDFVNR